MVLDELFDDAEVSCGEGEGLAFGELLQDSAGEGAAFDGVGASADLVEQDEAMAAAGEFEDRGEMADVAAESATIGLLELEFGAIIIKVEAVALEF